MKYLLLLCLASSAYAQESAIDRLRQQGRDLMENVYRRPEVVEYCTKNPQGSIAVKLNGEEYAYTVDCVAWKAYVALVEAGVR